MVGEIATRHALSKDVIAGVSERSGGVPLFVEEVTRLLLERGEAGRRAGDPADAATIARRPPRPARRRARDRADRRGAWARLLARAAASGGGTGGAGAARRARQARRRRAAVRRRRLAARELSLQARADPGRRLRQPVEEPPPDAAPPCGRGPARLARTGGRGARASFHASRPDRARDRMVGQSRRPGFAPLRLRRRRSRISARRSRWPTRRQERRQTLPLPRISG